MKVVVFHRRLAPPTYATPLMSLHNAELESSSTADKTIVNETSEKVSNYNEDGLSSVCHHHELLLSSNYNQLKNNRK